MQPPLLQYCVLDATVGGGAITTSASPGWRMVTSPPPVISKVVSATRTAVPAMAEFAGQRRTSLTRSVWMTTSQPHGAIVKRACSYKPRP